MKSEFICEFESLPSDFLDLFLKEEDSLNDVGKQTLLVAFQDKVCPAFSESLRITGNHAIHRRGNSPTGFGRSV